jgi:hypothetical protein
MSLIASIGKELLGLFVDDGSLALAILAWVGVIAATTSWLGLDGPLADGALFAGLVAILLENVLRRAAAR